MITGVGTITDPADQSAYPINGAGIEIVNGTAIVNRNEITKARRGITLSQGSTITAGADNTLDNLFVAVVSEVGSSVVLNFSDFTNYVESIADDAGTSDLTCNWWGNIAGPQNIPFAIPDGVYTPFATAPIANGAGGPCDGMAAPPPADVRVDPATADTDPNIVATLQEAIALVASGGTITVADGQHAMTPGVKINKPMTITADPNTLPIVDGLV